MPGEKEQEADRGKESRHAEAGGFELDVGADDAAEQQQGRERGEDERESLEPARFGLDDRTRQSCVPHEGGDRWRDALGQQRLAVDFFRGLLRAEGEQFAFLVDAFAADLGFFFLVDERLGQLRIVPVAFRRAAEISGII